MKLEDMTCEGRTAFRKTLEAIAAGNELDDYDLAAHFEVCRTALRACEYGNWVLNPSGFFWLDDTKPYPMTPEAIAAEMG
jgi:hypothetical protein